MSYLDTKQALIQKLLATSITGITSADIAFENNDFNPTSKSKYIAAYFIPATSDSMGKKINSGDEHRGIFQVSVFIKLNSVDASNNTRFVKGFIDYNKFLLQLFTIFYI